MIWEWIATITAGLGAAGLLMLLRLFYKRLPKSLIPAAAGSGMLLFQIHSEYTWFDHTRSLLPASAVVVAEVPESAFYKPWSYWQPQVLKFVAIDSAQTVRHPSEPLVQTHVYFFERRMSAQTLPILVDCQSGLQANAPASDQAPTKLAWGKTAYTDRIVQAICTEK